MMNYQRPRPEPHKSSRRSCGRKVAAKDARREAFSGIAQWKERRISNPLVAGSIPTPASGSATRKNVIWL